MRIIGRLRFLLIATAVFFLLSTVTVGLGGDSALAAGRDRHERHRSHQVSERYTDDRTGNTVVDEAEIESHEADSEPQSPGETADIEEEEGEVAIESEPEASEAQPVYKVMSISPENREEWMDDLNGLPQAEISSLDRALVMQYSQGSHGTSFSLLDHLDYIPEERDQGDCNNCWVWAGAGMMEIALDVQTGIKDRLSIQYLNSNYTRDDGWACDGGGLSGFTEFYAGAGMAVPWSNTNAWYQDGDGGTPDGSNVPAEDISTAPNYPITSIEAESIPTLEVGEETAINNIKSVLHQGRAIWFGFFMPEQEDWESFYSFWKYQPETAIWNPDYSCGKAWTEGGAGHAVLCVGYNDDPGVDNDYWIMLNSWGTAGGLRPSGLFRVDMHLDYDCNDGVDYNFLWETLDITFDTDGIYYFEDPNRETELYVYSDYDIFRFTSPEGYDSGPVQAGYMRVVEFYHRPYIRISHISEDMVLVAMTMLSKPDYCLAVAIDRDGNRVMSLVDPPGME